MKKLYCILLISAFCLVGCGNPDSSDPSTSATESDTSIESSTSETQTTITSSSSGFSFTAPNGTEISMHQEASGVLSKLGEPKSYLEAPSCAFQDGIDKIYSYQSFTLTSYEKDGKDFIYDVYFNDDTVTTKEGIYIGCMIDKVKETYGEDYKEESGMYTYTKEGTRLMFLTQENIVTSIEYSGLTE